LDPDCDAIQTPDDVCPHFDQIDSVDTDGNGIGNECECTDQSQNGIVNVADIMSMSNAIFGRERTSPLCDGNNDNRCNV
jgi:hypothetical protein